MKKLSTFVAFLLGFLCSYVGTAEAIPIRLDFRVNIELGAGAPAEQVSGSFEWVAESLTSDIQSLTDVDLTIATKVFQLSEVGSLSTSIGAIVNGVNAIAGNSDDFYLIWNWVGPYAVPRTFKYALSGYSGQIWEDEPHNPMGGSSFLDFDIYEVQPVPESATIILLGTGLLGLIGLRRKKILKK